MTKKLINMATGGLMSMPPYIKSLDEKDEGITPYDVSTPESARKGLPQRSLSKSRTRYSRGDSIKPLDPDEIPILEEHPLEPSDTKIAWLNNKDKKELIILNIKKENSDTYGKLSEKKKIELNN